MDEMQTTARAMVTATGNQAGSVERPGKALAALALNSERLELGTFSAADCGDALEIARRWQVPLKAMEPSGMMRDDSAELGFRFDGMTARLVDALRPLGIKIAPTMSAQQAGAWLAAMVAALSDLPPRVAIRAAQDAIHHPMQFINEVEAAVRERAEQVSARYSFALRRLERMQREIMEANKPPRPLLAGGPAPELTQADVDVMSEEMRRIGLACGALVQEGDEVKIAPPHQKRSPFDGQPFYCTTCQAGFDEFLKCENAGCALETVEASEARRKGEGQ